MTSFASFLERWLERKVAIYHGGMESDSGAPGEKDAHNSKIGEPLENKPFGDLSGRTRQGEQEAFIEGRRDIMVATKGFGMGIDKPNIRLILHRTPTANLEAYAQEAGRAGRDGELATAVLYYSPDSPVENADEDDERGKRTTIWSDVDVQNYFLSQRYVRRQDIIIMRAFLRTVRRRLEVHHKDGEGVDRYLYFTNDEAMAFFDQCAREPGLAGLDTAYSWPEFEERKRGRRESDEHRNILDKGHEYAEKTKYLKRILSVLYCIRPNVQGMANRLAFLETFQETGARIREPEVVDWVGIRDSNAYFGRILRDREVSREEFEAAIRGDDLLALARRLAMPLKELTQMLGDIKYCEGQFDKKGRWRSDLLDFWHIEAPKFGPAKGLNSLREWRDYAGARTRASKMAWDRAKKRGWHQPILDDWFYWPELNKPAGWEVLLGPAFEKKDFGKYLEAFMRLHDERERNDWASYYRLLTDYVGVNEDGSIPSGAQPKRCLRAVMLGYLKSYEVISGPSCLSCNVCVPDERFDQYTVEERKKVVVRIGPETEKLLDETESCAQIIPSEPLIAALFAAIGKGEAEGRSIIQYVAGWSGRLLQDNPEHRAALWIRLKMMMEGLIELQSREFIANAKRLVQLASDAEASDVWPLLASAHEVVPGDSEIYKMQADLCHRLGLFPEEVKAWRGIISLSKESYGVDAELLRKVYERLSSLYAPRAVLANLDFYNDCLLHLARLSRNTSEAQDRYAALVRDWNWKQLMTEIDNCVSGNQSSLPALAGLVCAWASSFDSKTRSVQVTSYLVAEGDFLIEQATDADLRLLVQRFGFFPMAAEPKLADRLAKLLSDSERDAQQRYVESCLNAVANGVDIPDRLLAAVNRVLFSGQTASTIKLLAPRAHHEASMSRILMVLARRFRPTSATELFGWLNAFPLSLHLSASPEAVQNVLQSAAQEPVASELSKEKLSLVAASVLDSLQEIVSHLLRHGDPKTYPLERIPMDYAKTRRNLGNACGTLAEVEPDAANCKRAIEAYEEALKVYALEHLPIDYARIQNNRAIAYRVLANSKRAIKAWEKALGVRTLARFPMEYAAIQNDLGDAYRVLAEMEAKADNSKRAIAAYEKALKVYTLEHFPEQYATTLCNLGIAYRTLAEVEAGADNSKRAIVACGEALKVFTLERFPLQYANAQTNLGDAYRTLADVEAKADNCKRAIAAYDEALKVYTLERFPERYATTQCNLGIAYRTLAEGEAKAWNCRRAIAACEEALKVYTLERFPEQYATTQCNLGIAYCKLADVEAKADNCKRAIAACEEALRVYTLDRFSEQYATTQCNLGIAYRTLAEVEATAWNCRRAIKAYGEALKVYTLERFVVQYAAVQDALVDVRHVLARWS
ncbi:MAG: helicase-related protein [Chloroflexota bacterium]